MKQTLAFLLCVLLILSACAPTATPVPTSTPTATPAPSATATPTLTPTPTATPTATPIPTLSPELVGGLEGVPDPKTTNPELFDLKNPDAPIPQFVNSMKMAGIEVTEEEVLQNLTYISKKNEGTPLVDQSGNPYVVAAYHLDPDPNKKDETLEGPIPLMIWDKEKGWGRVVSKDIKSKSGVDMGGTMSYLNMKHPELKDLMRREFSIYWTENDLKWSNIEPKPGVLNEKREQNVMNEVIKMMKNQWGMRIVAHSIINWESYPDYVKQERDPEKLRKLMISHILLVMKAFPQIDIWEVVNEYHPNGPNQDHLRTYLNNYVIEAFRTARQAAPNKELILSDNSLPDKNLINQLKQEGLIDGIAIHFHLDEDGIPPGYLEALEAYGLPIYISELDINIKNLDPNNLRRYLRQAEIANQVGRLCVALGPQCRAINQWAIGDKNSWYENGGAPKNRQSPHADATFFLDNYSPKLCYFTLIAPLLLY